MNRQKSLTVAAIVAVLMVLILTGSYMLKSPVFWILGILFSAYGFICSVSSFERWMERETPMLPVQTKKDQLWESDENFRATYDQIKREVEEGRL